MSEHNRVTTTARPGPRSRLLELGKDLLIILLLCSAVFLAGKTPMVTRLAAGPTGPAESGAPELRESSEAALPYLLAVRNQRGLYAVGYDREPVREAADRLSGLMGLALSSARHPEPVSPERWRELIEAPGVYCAFQGQIPLEALAVWLGEPGTIIGDAEELVLSWIGDRAWLGWHSHGTYTAAATDLDWRGDMGSVLEEFNPNGAAFAYTLAEQDPLYALLDPYVLVQMNPPAPAVYTAVSPDLIGDRDQLNRFLLSLGFESGGGTAYETSEGLAISESGDRLRISREGHIIYHAGDDGRFTVASAASVPDRREAAVAAWELATRALSGWKSEGSLAVTDVEPEEEGWVVTLHFRLDGIPVYMSDTGWAAQFRLQGREITDFTLHLRQYTARGEHTPVPRERLAAAALPNLDADGGRLLLCYTDAHTDTVTAGWAAALS